MLVMMLIAASGCTAQQVKPAATATPVATTITPSDATATVTPLPTSRPVTIATTATAAEELLAGTPAATPAPSTTYSRKPIISIRNNTFVPAELTVLPGTGVSWINEDAGVHIVKATGESKGKFTSAEMVNGASFLYTFGEAPGTYEFYDPGHPDMKGKIIVRKGDAIVGNPTPSAP